LTFLSSACLGKVAVSISEVRGALSQILLLPVRMIMRVVASRRDPQFNIRRLNSEHKYESYLETTGSLYISVFLSASSVDMGLKIMNNIHDP
jgi:hypothetical protein